MDSSDAHQNQMFQLLGDPKKAKTLARIAFDAAQGRGVMWVRGTELAKNNSFLFLLANSKSMTRHFERQWTVSMLLA